MRILVVEDDKTVRNAMVRALKSRRNREIREAESTSSAINWLMAYHFDVVVTDWNLPVGGGSDVLDLAKAQDIELVIVHSGENVADDRAVIVPKGVGDSISKVAELVAKFAAEQL
jgi:CheY-like chemotaxis protein